jgi:hypothetical protein
MQHANDQPSTGPQSPAKKKPRATGEKRGAESLGRIRAAQMGRRSLHHDYATQFQEPPAQRSGIGCPPIAQWPPMRSARRVGKGEAVMNPPWARAIEIAVVALIIAAIAVGVGEVSYQLVSLVK